MVEFAIKVHSFGLDKPQWVLAVDPVGERLLILHNDQSMHWYPLAVCTFVKAQTPDQPLVVMAVQPQKPKQQVVRARGHLDSNGQLIL